MPVPRRISLSAVELSGSAHERHQSMLTHNKNAVRRNSLSAAETDMEPKHNNRKMVDYSEPCATSSRRRTMGYKDIQIDLGYEDMQMEDRDKRGELTMDPSSRSISSSQGSSSRGSARRNNKPSSRLHRGSNGEEPQQDDYIKTPRGGTRKKLMSSRSAREEDDFSHMRTPGCLRKKLIARSKSCGEENSLVKTPRGSWKKRVMATSSVTSRDDDDYIKTPRGGRKKLTPRSASGSNGEDDDYYKTPRGTTKKRVSSRVSNCVARSLATRIPSSKSVDRPPRRSMSMSSQPRRTASPCQPKRTASPSRDVLGDSSRSDKRPMMSSSSQSRRTSTRDILADSSRSDVLAYTSDKPSTTQDVGETKHTTGSGTVSTIDDHKTLADDEDNEVFSVVSFPDQQSKHAAAADTIAGPQPAGGCTCCAQQQGGPILSWTCQCGCAMDVVMKFCGKCGTPRNWACQECQFDQNLCDFGFCGNCGAKRTEATNKKRNNQRRATSVTVVPNIVDLRQ